MSPSGVSCTPARPGRAPSRAMYCWRAARPFWTPRPGGEELGELRGAGPMHTGGGLLQLGRSVRTRGLSEPAASGHCRRVVAVIRNGVAYPPEAVDEKSLLLHSCVRWGRQTGRMVLRKVGVAVAALCALTAVGAVIGLGWSSDGDPPSLGPEIVVPLSESSGEPSSPPSRSVVPSAAPPPSAVASTPSPAPTSSAQPGGRPVPRPSPPRSDDGASPSPSAGWRARTGSDDDGDDGGSDG